MTQSYSRANITVDYHNIKTLQIEVYKTQRFVLPENEIMRGTLRFNYLNHLKSRRLNSKLYSLKSKNIQFEN